MPRPRRVVMERLAKGESHTAAIHKAVKSFKPFHVVNGELLSQEEDKFYVVYTAPRGGERKVMASRNKRINAIKLRDLLTEAWAEGFFTGRSEVS